MIFEAIFNDKKKIVLLKAESVLKCDCSNKPFKAIIVSEYQAESENDEEDDLIQKFQRRTGNRRQPKENYASGDI